jgi:hypothetical protein
MATYSKLALSGSINGKQIKIGGTTSPGTLIHTAVESLLDYDEIYLYVTNNHSAAENLTLEWGGSSSEDQIKMAIPAQTGLYLIVPGLVIQNGLTIRAFAGSANVLSISGWVNRITA